MTPPAAEATTTSSPSNTTNCSPSTLTQMVEEVSLDRIAGNPKVLRSIDSAHEGEEKTEPCSGAASDSGHDEKREIWEHMTPAAWHSSISEQGSVFKDTYNATRRQVLDTARLHGHDVIIEVGCGTGDVIGQLYDNLPGDDQDMVSVPRFGIDINEEFLKFCRDCYLSGRTQGDDDVDGDAVDDGTASASVSSQQEEKTAPNNARNNDNLHFLSADALRLEEWWEAKIQPKYNFKRPLVTCVNNTLNIMPVALRGAVVAQMLKVAGPEGRCMVSYWNGQFFSHAVMNYYAKNPHLCGPFDLKKHVDFERRSLHTPSNYSTLWQNVTEVQQLLRAYDVDVENVTDNFLVSGEDHINCDGLSIFIWFSQESTSMAKAYYDSDDAQKFYASVWGEDNLHVGRYDLIQEKGLTSAQRVSKAQEMHELQFLQLIEAKCLPGQPQLRVVDFGCGYGGLLRRIYATGCVWNGIGVDISHRMCVQARHLNDKLLEDAGANTGDLTILEESYLDVSVADESADLVISMDALLHVGPQRQRRAIAEAARVLRPGGWIIFSDIMQADVVDAKQMQPIYDRISLSKMGTVSNYRQTLEKAGFTQFEFFDSSEQIATHYGTVRQVLMEKQTTLGLSGEYFTKMGAGLATWRDSSPNNIEWGLMVAQKTKKADLSVL